MEQTRNFEEVAKQLEKTQVLSPAEQILAGAQGQVPYTLATEGDRILGAPSYFNDQTLSRSMTALGLSTTIPEEPADVEGYESSPLLNASRIASKSAIDLVGLNEDEVFDANESLGNDSMPFRTATTGGMAPQVSMTPSRSLIVSNVSPLMNDNYIQVLFQMSGDLQGIRTEYRLQGIFQVTYYDIRSAIAAKEQLNGMAVAGQYLNVQYATLPGAVGSFTDATLVVSNIDPNVDAQQVAASLSRFGDVKGVHVIPSKDNCRLVEFYDIRHAGAAMETLNKSEDRANPRTPAAFEQTSSHHQLGKEALDANPEGTSRSLDDVSQVGNQIEGLSLKDALTTPYSPAGRLTKSVSFGSGLGDVRHYSETDSPTSGAKRAVQLTPDLAARLKVADTAPDLSGLMSGLSPKLGTFGSSPALGALNRGMSNSTSVETGLDSYGQSFGNQGFDTGLASALGQGLGLGMGMGLNNPYLQQPAGLVPQAGNNLMQTIAAAQAAGFSIYDILARLPNANLTQLLAAHNSALGNPPGSLLGSLTGNPSGLSALNTLQRNSAGIGSPSYTLGSGMSSGLDMGMSKSASSPALNLSSEERDQSTHRFGGRLSRRNVDPLIEAERRAQQQRLYALDLDKIRSGEDKRTTLMIKNIPNKYTQKMLLASIDETLRGKYDFFYLPIDFKNKCNVGYGFINMREPEDIIPLVERFHNKKWERFNSEKICCVAYGRIQGKQALINHFQNSSLMHEDKKHRPVLFVSNGPNKGEPEPFPVGSNIRPKITLKDRDFRSRERSGHWT